jgi:hypothetical protein
LQVISDIGQEIDAKAEPVQEPIAYFDLQEHLFYWAKNTVIGNVPVSIKVEPMALYSQPKDGLRKAAQMALDLLKENLIAFGPCDHDVGICNCDIEQCIDLLRKELGHG